METNILFLSIILGLIISFSFSKPYTFILKPGEQDSQFQPFYIDGKGKVGDVEVNLLFAVSILSPAIGFYGTRKPYDCKDTSGNPSLFDFENILSGNFKEGTKGEGKLILIPKDNSEFSISNIPVYLYNRGLHESYRYGKEQASLGLSYSLSEGKNSKGLDNSDSTWEIFKKLDIEKKFSIQKWGVTEGSGNKKVFSSELYIGGRPSDFNDNNNESIASFNIVDDKESPFWNINFETMEFNGKNISLINKHNKKPYKIRLIVESKKIEFPTEFKELIENTGCKITTSDDKDDGNLLICQNINEKSDKTSITFYNSDDTIKLKGEVDNLNRILPVYYSKKENYFIANIYFRDTEDDDYIAMPLIVFKKFHVYFDGKDNKVQFYNTDKDLLDKIEKKEEVKPGPNNNDLLKYIKSHIFSFIIICAIVLIVFSLMISICRSKGSDDDIHITSDTFDD